MLKLIVIMLLIPSVTFARGGTHSRISIKIKSKTGREITKQISIKPSEGRNAPQHFGFYKGTNKSRYKLWNVEQYKGLKTNLPD